MTAPRLAAVSVVAVLLALLMSWWSAPDTGPPVVAPAPPAPVRTAPATSATSATSRRPTTATPAPRPSGSGVAPLPEHHAAPFVPPRRVVGEAHSADQQGIGTAALERRAELVRCWDDHQAGGGSAGRFTVRVTVTDDGNGHGVAVADVPQVSDDPDLQACVKAAFDDALFDSPGDHAQSVVWPVPLGPVTGE